MQSRPPESWNRMRSALRNAGLEDAVVENLKEWLDRDPLRPVQVEVTAEQVRRLGIAIDTPN